MSVYDRQIQTALAMIQRRGQLVTWRKLGVAVADPLQPWIVTAATNVDYTVSMVFLPVSRVEERFVQYMTGTNIPAGSEIGYMGAVSFTPDMGDIIIRDGKEYRIKCLDVIAPDGSPILYTMELYL